MISSSRAKALSAARAYLNMRGFEVLEEGWSLGRYRLDVIAKKGEVVYFITVRHHPSGQLSSPSISQSSNQRRLKAAEAWVAETKWNQAKRYYSLDLSGREYSVLSFNEDLL